MVRSLTRTGAASTATLSTTFAIAMLPAVVALHVAHNWEYLTVESQRLVPLLADPLGLGWSLLPTRGLRPNSFLGSPSITWYAGTALVALGFGGASAATHRAALRLRLASDPH